MHGCVLPFLYLNLSTVVIDSLKLTFPGVIFVGVSDRTQCHFVIVVVVVGRPGKTTEISESAH